MTKKRPRISRVGHILIAVFSLLGLPNPLSAADRGDTPQSQSGAPAPQTTIRKFPENLGRNFLALFSRANVTPFVIGSVASGGMAVLDHRIQDAWAVKDGSSLMGTIGATAGGAPVVVPAVAGLLILGHYSANDRFHSYSYAVAQGVVLETGIVEGLKIAVRRERPDGSDQYSFPSGHAGASFTIATVTAHYYGWRAGIIGYGAAAFIAASRSRENKHWASDLAAGATIGYIVGRTVSRQTGITLRVKKIVLLPSIDLRHKVIGIALWRDSD